MEKSEPKSMSDLPNIMLSNCHSWIEFADRAKPRVCECLDYAWGMGTRLGMHLFFVHNVPSRGGAFVRVFISCTVQYHPLRQEVG